MSESGVSARNVKMGTVVDAVRWAKHTMLVVIGTPSGSPERRAKLDELVRATARARALADDYKGSLAIELRLALHAAEVGLRRLQGASVASTSPDEPAKAKKTPRKVHPRRLSGGAGR